MRRGCDREYLLDVIVKEAKNNSPNKRDQQVNAEPWHLQAAEVT
jgi:hypothetical protein